MEINEAFAAQAIAVNRQMGWDTLEGQRQRRRDRARPSDRRLGLPHPGHAAARNAEARREEGPRLAVHRRRHGRRAGCRTLDQKGMTHASHGSGQTGRQKPAGLGTVRRSAARGVRHRRHGRHRQRDLPAPRRWPGTPSSPAACPATTGRRSGWARCARTASACTPPRATSPTSRAAPSMFYNVRSIVGTVDILVNNAGITRDARVQAHDRARLDTR